MSATDSARCRTCGKPINNLPQYLADALSIDVTGRCPLQCQDCFNTDLVHCKDPALSRKPPTATDIKELHKAGMPIDDIAATLDITVGRVRSALHFGGEDSA